MAVSFVPERDEPVLGDQPFKLAVFGVNVSHGCSMSTAEGHIVADWKESVELTIAAEKAGLMRWYQSLDGKVSAGKQTSDIEVLRPMLGRQGLQQKQRKSISFQRPTYQRFTLS